MYDTMTFLLYKDPFMSLYSISIFVMHLNLELAYYVPQKNFEACMLICVQYSQYIFILLQCKQSKRMLILYGQAALDGI